MFQVVNFRCKQNKKFAITGYDWGLEHRTIVWLSLIWAIIDNWQSGEWNNSKYEVHTRGHNPFAFFVLLIWVTLSSRNWSNHLQCKIFSSQFVTHGQHVGLIKDVKLIKDCRLSKCDRAEKKRTRGLREEQQQKIDRLTKPWQVSNYRRWWEGERVVSFFFLHSWRVKHTKQQETSYCLCFTL